jgi:hypothetical protein
MSADILRDLYDQRAFSIRELALLLGGISETAAYRYFGETELRFGHLLSIMSHAKDDRVRERLLNELCAGSGWTATRLPAELDINGDGDVDTHDALAGTVETIDRASKALKSLLRHGDKAGRYIDAQAALRDAAEKSLAALAVIDWLQAHQSKRRKAREVIRG